MLGLHASRAAQVQAPSPGLVARPAQAPHGGLLALALIPADAPAALLARPDRRV